MTDQQYVDLLNQHASLLLQQANQSVDCASAPLFQLMEWAEPELDFQDKYLNALQGTLQNLQGWPDQNAAVLELLKSKDDPDAVRLSVEEFQQENDPVKAAWLLWDALHSKLGAEVVGYHRDGV